MWICENCGEEFQEPILRKTTFETEFGVSHLFPTSHECTIKECPRCNSDDIEEMRLCDICGEYCKEDDLEDTTEAVNGGVGYACPQCIQDCDIKFI